MVSDTNGKERSARSIVVELIAGAAGRTGLHVAPGDVQIERPNDPEHGDLSSNIALIQARTVGRKPRDMAGEIVKRLEIDPDFIAHVEVAGPGFINFTFARPYLWNQIALINERGGRYGDSGLGGGRRIQVEFVSANPTGPLVIVSARAAAVGSALVNVLRKVGYDVEAEYYINDAGSQVEKLGHSMLVRFRQNRGEDVDFPEDGYPGEYLTRIAADVPPDEGDAWIAHGGAETIAAFGQFALDRLIDMIARDLEFFGVHFDVFFRESELRHDGGEVEQVFDIFSTRGALYEEEGAVWFRSSDYGDEKDRVVVRSDGTPTYFLTDAAYHLNKFRRGFSHVIDIFGPDHHGHIQRLQAASRVFGADTGWLDVLTVQWVRLIEEGKQISMSKRGGEFVTLRDLIEDVGADAAKFFFLMRKTNAHLDFDLTLARSESEENPVYYVQYAHARIASVVAFARGEGVDFPTDTSCLELLREPEEIDLMRRIVIFPQLVEGAAITREPHRLTSYAQQLAATFHHFYHICRIVSKNRRLSEARLLLAEATRIVLAESLRIVGISAPDRM